MASESKFQIPTQNVLPSRGVDDDLVELHEGNIRTATHLFSSFTNLQVCEVVFQSPSDYIHFDWDVASDGLTVIDYYKNASYVGASTQTQIVPFNPNFTINPDSTVTDSGNLLIYANSSNNFNAGSDGTLYRQGMLMGGNVISVGGESQSQLICNTGTWYVMRMTNTSGSTKFLTVQARYHGQE